MIWQDFVITVILIFLSYALIPQVYKGFKEKKGLINLQTSIITSVGMYTLSYIYFTLNLYFSTIIGVVTGTLWLILLIQRIKYH